MERKVVLTGSLSFIGFPELLQLLSGSESTGVLRLQSPYTSVPAKVYFQGGNPIDAASGALRGLDALYSLFGWTDGRFEFSQEPVHQAVVIQRSLMEIILEGLRRLDDGQTERLGAVTRQRPAAEPAGSDTVPLINNPLAHYVPLADEESFRKGTRIVEQGKYGNWLWIVLQGEVQVVLETPGGPLPVYRIGEGGCVGNLSGLFRRGMQRLATVLAASERVQLGVLDPSPFHQQWSELSRDMRAFIYSVDHRLGKVFAQLAALCGGRQRTPDAGELGTVIREGDRSRDLLRVLKGEAFVMRRTHRGWIMLAHLSEGDIFGHVPFLQFGHEPDAASVLGSRDLGTECLPVHTLEEEYARLLPLFRSILDFTAACVFQATAKMLALWEGGKEAGAP